MVIRGGKGHCPVIGMYKPRKNAENLKISSLWTGMLKPYLRNTKKFCPPGLNLHKKKA